MNVAQYRAALAIPRVRALLVFAWVARVPLAGTGVALTLHVVMSLDRGYAAAGVVAMAATVGQAVGAPWRGRVVDRRGVRAAVLPSVLVAGGVWACVPFVGYWGLVVAAVVGGLWCIPLFSLPRQSLAVLTPRELHRPVFALDSVGVEASYALGPVLAVLVAETVSTRAALIVLGVLTVASGVALMLFDPPTRSVEGGPDDGVAGLPTEPARGGREGGAPGVPVPGHGAEVVPRRRWRSGALAGILAVSATAALVLSGTEVAMVALLREQDASSLIGVVFACWCLGSVVGGVVYGAVRRPIPLPLLLLTLAGLTAPVGWASSPLALACLLGAAGAACAPTVIATTEAVSAMVPEQVRGEALGWHGASFTAGTALGAPVAGAVIDSVAAWAGFVVVGAIGTGVAVGGLVLRVLPRARGGGRGGHPVPAGRAGLPGSGPGTLSC